MPEQFHGEEPIGPDENGELARYHDVRACADQCEGVQGGHCVWQPGMLREMPMGSREVSKILLAALAGACTIDGVIRECRFMRMLLNAEASAALGKGAEN